MRVARAGGHTDMAGRQYGVNEMFEGSEMMRVRHRRTIAVHYRATLQFVLMAGIPYNSRCVQRNGQR